MHLLVKKLENVQAQHLIEMAELQHWPHTLAFRLTGLPVQLSSLPQAFEYRDAMFILRSGILHQPGHFTGFVSCPKGWMFYDGYDPPNHLPPRFTFFPLSEPEKVTDGCRLDTVYYEVIVGGTDIDDNNRENLFSDYNFDWGNKFYSTNNYCDMQRQLD